MIFFAVNAGVAISGPLCRPCLAWYSPFQTRSDVVHLSKTHLKERMSLVKDARLCMLNDRLTILQTLDQIGRLSRWHIQVLNSSALTNNKASRPTFPPVLRSYLSHKVCSWIFVRALRAASLFKVDCQY